MIMFRCVIAMALAIISFNAQCATFLVGTGAGCNFNTIQSGIDAAAINPGADVVRISNATTWGPGGVTIGQQDLTLDGRFATCTDTVVNGNYAQLVGNAINPDARPAMITITGSGVRRLTGLQIRSNVRGVDSFGGAIRYSGSGELILSDMDVRNNRAEYGGAIASSGSGILTLSENVLIESNIADRNGGGMTISGGSVLYAIGNNLSIANNEAYGEGGGIRVGQARAFIASPGRGGSAVLQSNRAAISFDGGSGDGGAIFTGIDSQVVVFSIDPNAPTRIADNRAREKGGAVYLDVQNVNAATLCLMDVHLSGNSANGGAALYADLDFLANSNMIYNVPARDECVVPANAPAQPVRCNRTAAGCNVIEGHITQTISGTPSGGGVVTARKNIELLMRDASFVNNTAGFMINSDEAGQIVLNTALMAGNTTSSSVIRLGFAAVNQGLVMRNVTIAGNTIASSNPSVWLEAVPGTPTSVNFNNNLIFQPARTAVTAAFGIGNGAATNWDFNATNAPQVLPSPSQLVLSDARFENAAFNDYRLRIGSVAVSAFAAGSVLNANFDLDGRQRPITLGIFSPDVSNVDVGAYERQETDPWLVNGGFSAAAQLRYWEPSSNGEAIPGVFWNSQDAAGNPTSGSALVNLPASLAQRLTVLRRCFNVPAPGRYTINAKAQRGSGINADGAVLNFRVYNNDATCSGSNQLIGDAAFASGSGFQPLATPLQLTIPSTTGNTTIEIRLEATTGLNLNGLTNVSFDDISITGAPLVPEAIFANGFE